MAEKMPHFVARPLSAMSCVYFRRLVHSEDDRAHDVEGVHVS